MSYALETKKRKFDRLLESLTDVPPSEAQLLPSRTSSKVLVNGSTTKATSRETTSSASKKQRITASSNEPTSNSPLVGHYLPSSRAAFLERLETYRHVTRWHIPSTIPINAAEWAKRGWVCADTDTVSCGSCDARIVIDLNINDKNENDLQASNPSEPDKSVVDTQDDRPDEEDDISVEVYAALVDRYREMIITSHSESCPWRRRGCDASIQRIEGLLNTNGTIASMRTRFESIILRLEEIPPVVDLPHLEQMSVPEDLALEELGFIPANLNATRLALCGWEYKETDVIECKHCFRSLGLWLYRGATPTVEHLDAVDSHLEYCPWRSSEAQDTELMVYADPEKSGTGRVEFPGWALVYHAIKKHQNKRRSSADQSILSFSQLDGADINREQLSPEQRDKKMKDIMRRIKDIKKPFNITSLLRRRDKSDK